jgi:signal transduction histidine kinase
MAYQGYYCARQAVEDVQADHLRSVLKSRQARVEQWFGEIKSSLTFVETLPWTSRSCLTCWDGHGHGHGLCRRSCDLLESLNRHSCCFVRVATFKQDWSLLNQSRKKEWEGELVLSAAFKEKVEASHRYEVSRARIDSAGRAILHVGRRVRGEVPDLDTYLVAELRLAGCVHHIFADPSFLGDTGKVYMLTHEGEYLHIADGEADGADRARSLPAAMRLPDPDERHSSVFTYEDHRGVQVLGASLPIPFFEWILVAEIDQAEAFAWFGILRHRAWITGAVTLLLVLVLAAGLSRHLSRPLRKLADTSRKIAAGNLNERLGHGFGGEAEEVGRAFNQMLDELALSRARLLQAASLAAVGELSTSIVHEMRNPLSSVKINLQALKRKVEGDAAHTELALIGLNQVARLEKMLTDLLNYGRPIALHPRPLRFEDVATDVLEVTRPAAEEKGVALEVENALDGTPVPGDPEQLWQALSNLVANAVQAAPEGGKVVLRGERRKEDPDWIALSVRDNGPGVKASIRENIFQPFFTTREGGTGLGLANVKKIVEVHGGRVELDAQDGPGAVFTLFLPAKGAPA